MLTIALTSQYNLSKNLPDIFWVSGKVQECGSGSKIKKISWYSNCTVMVLPCGWGAGLRHISLFFKFTEAAFRKGDRCNFQAEARRFGRWIRKSI
jgi:hypothetical protein